MTNTFPSAPKDSRKRAWANSAGSSSGKIPPYLYCIPKSGIGNATNTVMPSKQTTVGKR